MITSYKAIYNLFGSGIYHKPHYIFKSKVYEFHNGSISLFSGNDTRMAGYINGIHRYMRMRKSLIATVSSAELNTMSLNSKLSKVVSYIQDDKYQEGIYVIFKLLFPRILVLHIEDSQKSGMEKVFYNYRMTRISITKS